MLAHIFKYLYNAYDAATLEGPVDLRCTPEALVNRSLHQLGAVVRPPCLKKPVVDVRKRLQRVLLRHPDLWLPLSIPASSSMKGCFHVSHIILPALSHTCIRLPICVPPRESVCLACGCLPPAHLPLIGLRCLSFRKGQPLFDICRNALMYTSRGLVYMSSTCHCSLIRVHRTRCSLSNVMPSSRSTVHKGAKGKVTFDPQAWTQRF